jgi:membrane protease YdiL (CAAX protease family)
MIAAVIFGALYAFAHLTQLFILRSSGEDAGLVLSAVDPKTGLSGGLTFGLWLLVANLVNSAMEEGLFRGAMIRHFLLRFSGWGAILFQASLFALWHLSWPIRHLLDGTATLGEAGFEAMTLLLGTFISGVVYGYLYLKTDNLWGVFLAHTINNGIFNVLFIRTGLGLQSGLDFMPFTLMFLIGHLATIPIIWWATKRLALPQVRPWGEFEEPGIPAALTNTA